MKRIGHFVSSFAVVLILLAATTAIYSAEGRFAGISPDQREKLKALAMETREKTDRERSALLRARNDLAQVYQEYNLDERKAKAALERVSNVQLNLLDIHLDNQISIRNILSAEQFSEFHRMVKRFRGHGMAGMGPPDQMILSPLPDMRLLDSVGVEPEQKRRLVKLLAPNREDAQLSDRLRRNTQRILDIYSDYDLDAGAARKTIGEIHRDQAKLSERNHKRQQALREVLTCEQFERLAQEMAKMAARKMEDRGYPRDRKGPLRAPR